MPDHRPGGRLRFPRLTWRTRDDATGREEHYWLFRQRRGWLVLLVSENALQELQFGSLFDLETYIDDTHEPGAWPLLGAAAAFGASEQYEHH